MSDETDMETEVLSLRRREGVEGNLHQCPIN
jgi:hypothetical protein